MNTFFTSISNREYATTILVVSFLVFCLIKSKDVRTALLRVLKLMFFSKITVWFLIPTVYLVVVTFIMMKLCIWDISLLKDSIMSIVGCLILCGKTLNVNEFKTIYKENLLGYFTAIYFLEFFVNAYNFNIIVEIVLVAFTTMVFSTRTYMNYLNEDTQNLNEAKKLLDGIQIMLGLFIILHSCYFAIKEPTQILNLHSLQILLLPLVYTVILCPVCYMMWLYVKYESTLTSIFVVRDNLNKHISNKKLFFKTFNLCGINIKRLKLWQHYFLSSYSCYDEKLNINNMIKEFQYRYKQLDSPQTESDISLYSALGFMCKWNFPISEYKYSDYSDGFGHYQALSYNTNDTYKYYCVIGNQQYPQSYQLNNFISDNKNSTEEISIFSDYCQDLYYKIFKENINNKYITAIQKFNKFTFEKDVYRIIFNTETNINGTICSISFCINKINPVEISDYELNYTVYK